MSLALYLTCIWDRDNKAHFFQEGDEVISEETVTPIDPSGSNGVHKLQLTFQLPVVIWLLEDVSFGIWVRP